MIKKINISIAIINIIEAICYFTPVCITGKYWEKEYITYSVTSKRDMNIFDCGGLLGQPIAILLFLATLIVAAIYLYKAIKERKELLKNDWIVTVARSVILIIFLYYANEEATTWYSNSMYTYEICWMFYIIIALNVISIALAMVLKFGKQYENVTTKSGDKNAKATEPIDEIMAYKELLDSGVITQEEFDEKKKQILKL